MSKTTVKKRGVVHQLLRKKNRKRLKRSIVILIAVIAIAFVVIGENKYKDCASGDAEAMATTEYNGEVAIELNYGEPGFTDDELKNAAEKPNGFEEYGKLDKLGRATYAYASVCTATMPEPGEKRESLYSVTPSGWQRINFWQRCHLIGYQLTAENANERNLITGCNNLNITGMLPFENEIAQYIRENSDKHVLYKVEPVYEGDDLVAKGVIMQAESAEDKGATLKFNVFVLNYEPGYIINYSNGKVEEDPEHQTEVILSNTTAEYTGDAVSCKQAKVKGSTGEVRYIYYTDRDAKNRTTEAEGAASQGSAPSRPGTYYVRAMVRGDEWYAKGISNIAKLRIVKK